MASHLKRRSLLRMILGALGGGWAFSFLGCAPWRRAKGPSASGPSRETPDRLKESLAARAQRNYAEDGIPMFLVCENLAPDRIASRPGTDFDEGKRLARTLRDTAGVF